MVWIIPQSLTSVCAPATAESTSDCVAASLASERLLTRRSKPSPAKSYLREWKAGRLTRLRSGLTSSLSLGQNFATEWISSQAAIRASHSAAPGSDSAEKTLATSGPTSQMEFQFCDPGCASLKTSKDTSALDSEKSSSIWADLVTRRRGEYSARLKSARPISASGSSSWPTANARDWKDSGATQGNRVSPNLGTAVHHFGPAAPANPSSDGSRPELWGTPTVLSRVRSPETLAKCLRFRQANGQTSVPEYLEEQVIKSWATPEAKNQVGYQVGQDGTKWPKLGSQAQAWATPASHDRTHTPRKVDHGIQLANQAGGKLNPRWVETLMGLPVGWTMPSCASPVIPESTSFASSETASCPQSPSEPL